MVEKSIAGEHFVQIGVTALRDANGAFLPAVPLYIKVDADQVNKDTNMSAQEDKLCADISGIFAEKFSQYIRAEQREARKRGNT